MMCRHPGMFTDTFPTLSVPNEDFSERDERWLIEAFVERVRLLDGDRGTNRYRNEKSLKRIIEELSKRWEMNIIGVNDELVIAFNLQKEFLMEKEES